MYSECSRVLCVCVLMRTHLCSFLAKAQCERWRSGSVWWEGRSLECRWLWHSCFAEVWYSARQLQLCCTGKTDQQQEVSVYFLIFTHLYVHIHVKSVGLLRRTHLATFSFFPSVFFLTGLWIWLARCFWVEFLTCLRTSRLLQENLLAAWKTCILITDQWTWQDSLLIMALYLVRVIVYSVMIVTSCICDRLWWFQHTLPFKSLEVWKKLIKNH